MDEWTSNIADAAVYKSGQTIRVAKPGRYQFYEVESHNEYYLPCSKTEAGKRKVGGEFELDLGDEKEVTLSNKKHRDILQIKKVDKETKVELKNAGFVIKKGYQYAIGGIITGTTPAKNTPSARWTEDINQATVINLGNL